MKRCKLAILKTELDQDYRRWEEACRALPELADWVSIDVDSADWYEQVVSQSVDGLLAMPAGITSAYKTMYDERVRILNTAAGIPVYPTLEEIEVYENKKYLAYWLKANAVPHPKTEVFYITSEALRFAAQADLPLVAKTSVGASGRGVSILKTRESALEYVKNTFSGRGARRNIGPNWRRKGFVGRVFKKLLNPAAFKAKLGEYKTQHTENQKDFVIFQAFIPHDFEWRCVRIGDSFFAHKKMVKDEKASGSLIKGYENPPLRLLDFVKTVTDKRGFWSQAVDIFETTDGRYLVNEMQCTFGQSDPYQMLVDGVPGRYRKLGGQWVFEAGDFNRHQSFLLRLEHFIEILNRK
jgi:glutathione synthase/RimK-type ligase-like ATP-grasp enzyme